MDNRDGAQAPGATQPLLVAGGRALGGAAAVVAVATLSSKVLGFVRDLVLAHRFGATGHTDAYVFSSNLPLVLFAAVGVALTTVFIPLFAELLTQKDQATAERFAANVNGAVTVVVSVLVVLAELASGPLVRALAPRQGVNAWSPQQVHEAVVLLRIMAPLILFYGWSGVVGGALNVRGFFGPNAAMGIPQNLVIIAAIVLASLHGRQDIYLVAWGSLLGTFTTYLVQLPALWRSRFRVGWRLDWRDPLLRRMGRLVVPAALTALAQQAGNLVIQVLGARLQTGELTDFTYASRLQLLAYSILGMSIATVLYPSLASAAATRDMGVFRSTLRRGLGLVNFVTLPVMGTMLFLSLPLVRVLFLSSHSRFTALDAERMAIALVFLTLGTLAFGWQDYLNRTFFAMQDTRTPLFAAATGVAVNISLAVSLYQWLGLRGLGLAMACGWFAAVVFLIIQLRRRMGLMGGRHVLSSGLRMAAAALVSFGAAQLAYPLLQTAFGGGERWMSQLLALLVTAGGATGLYCVGCRLLRVPELEQAGIMLRGLLGRFARAAG